MRRGHVHARSGVWEWFESEITDLADGSVARRVLHFQAPDDASDRMERRLPRIWGDYSDATITALAREPDEREFRDAAGTKWTVVPLEVHPPQAMAVPLDWEPPPHQMRFTAAGHEPVVSELGRGIYLGDLTLEELQEALTDGG